GDLHPLYRAVVTAPGDLLAAGDRAVVDPAERDAAKIGGRVEVGDVRLQRRARLVDRRRNRLPDHVEQRLQVVAVGHLAVNRAGQRGTARARGGVHDGELNLLLGGVQVNEQLVAGVDDLGDPRVGP